MADKCNHQFQDIEMTEDILTILQSSPHIEMLSESEQEEAEGYAIGIEDDGGGPVLSWLSQCSQCGEICLSDNGGNYIYCFETH